MSEKKDLSIVANIALVIFLVLFIIILSKLPFPEHYDFWRKAGVCAASCFVGILVYSIVILFVERIFKILVELLAVFVLFLDVLFIAFCWSFFEEAKLIVLDWFPTVSDNLTTITIVSIVSILLIFNFFVMIILYPFSNIAGANIGVEID
ncbi:hypothetical protein [uncultured Sunxiuqinia sp.]|uniref:hypothetical protein n=1 Tax=uncultured Sunxiuqinia sp. TaxID=1573825 RepID=UPI002AA95653|nr:hypothetical protein [uncultured Sunxiuqinia sp.]